MLFQNLRWAALATLCLVEAAANAREQIRHTATPTHDTVPSTPHHGQAPGTSGLRKKVRLFQTDRYLENYVASLFDEIGHDKLDGSTLVLGGDGRFHNDVAVQTILRMAAAYGVRRVWVGVDGILSTPAASAVIRERENGCAVGGIILSASHNPGGPDEDFGIKYNCENGGPAPESLTAGVYARTQAIREYRICSSLPDTDLSCEARHLFCASPDEEPFFEVEVISPTHDYVALLARFFDMDAIRALLARPDVRFVFDGMHGVAGPYAVALFRDLLGLPISSLVACEPKPDFGGEHPDPNLKYAARLVRTMGLDPEGRCLAEAEGPEPPTLGAAADGDADRNMILGCRFFVTPSDSVAIIAAHAHLLPGLAKAGGLKALARSMPTSGALDRVAAALGLPLFEVPTGWKFFGNLMDSHLLGGAELSPLICGEESFGTGSSHIREKDGLWAVLAWLSILASYNTDASAPLVSVADIVRQHWKRYGRNFYTRYDYEAVDAERAAEVVEALLATSSENARQPVAVDEFSYTDPVDSSVASKQGVRLLFADGSRIVLRLSGTGSVGATIRIYIERYVPPGSNELDADPGDALRPLVDLALELTRIRELTGRAEPTVIT